MPKCTDQSAPYKPLLKKIKIEPFDLSQVGNEKNRPNKQRAVTTSGFFPPIFAKLKVI